jgi:uncharacterized protein YecE (DUF72 family)
MTMDRTRGRLFVGTSGFSYAAWAPRFYAPGTRSADLLKAYAARLNACELNNTFYQQPTAPKVSAWLAATPSEFRFSVKAQRGGSWRSMAGSAAESVPWLTEPYRLFGERLGTVLFRVPETTKRNDDALAQLLLAWPRDMPLTMEFQHPSWLVDETLAQLMGAGAALCATDLDSGEPPDVRVTGTFLYLRLRRSTYTDDDLADWANRLEPFLADGLDAFVFFRHDEHGDSAVRAERFRRLLGGGALGGDGDVQRAGEPRGGGLGS